MHLPILHVDKCIICLYACQVFEIKTNFAGILARRVDGMFWVSAVYASTLLHEVELHALLKGDISTSDGRRSYFTSVSDGEFFIPDR